ncbi:hypothetical protein FQV27_08355 [Paracoccus aurantiacus]|uniref:PNPLA domain-containing protein n=1 Tax=Paracoccus aurantiacus TaxID=2599412 RepID=A0A5C6S3X7_9RHOB|nr:patatin-like phospholipase family protein [Paracoccus aurantiacus]TXB68987.1 hypothetical protein FQV27_08355 [Paracoccus aurantiacus]
MRKSVAGLLLAIILAGCGGTPRAIPPAERYDLAQVAGYQSIRVYADLQDYTAPQDALTRAAAVRLGAGRIDLLALSGGSDAGAYGAGVLNGWTQHGDRPEFTIVTGVSTGALIAPFAFLGPAYDRQLRDFYTQTKVSDIVLPRPITALFGSSSVGDSAPLARQIRTAMTPAVIDAIAAERRKGRLLLVGTTNLDAQRQVVWDIGRIAASGQPDRVELIHKVLLASASIPGAFPPVRIDVTIDGQRYQEMHVDGGVTRGIFAYPPGANPPVRTAPRHMWVIRNSKLTPEYDETGGNIVAISGRSISTMIKAQSNADIQTMREQAREDGFAFHLTAVPPNFPVQPEMPFDQSYMRSLFETGRKAAIDGAVWRIFPANGVIGGVASAKGSFN